MFVGSEETASLAEEEFTFGDETGTCRMTRGESDPLTPAFLRQKISTFDYYNTACYSFA